MFVIAKPGDEIALDFDAAPRPLPDGWTRTFLLLADGFSKEMDINSASPDTVEPLPFHGDDTLSVSRHRSTIPTRPTITRYRETYNTRTVVQSVAVARWIRAPASKPEACSPEPYAYPLRRGRVPDRPAESARAASDAREHRSDARA